MVHAEPQCAGAYGASADFADMLSVRASHMFKPKFSVGGDCARAWVSAGMIH